MKLYREQDTRPGCLLEKLSWSDQGYRLSLSNRFCIRFLYAVFISSFKKLMSMKSNQLDFALSIFLKMFSCCFACNPSVLNAEIKSLRLIFSSYRSMLMPNLHHPSDLPMQSPPSRRPEKISDPIRVDKSGKSFSGACPHYL